MNEDAWTLFWHNFLYEINGMYRAYEKSRTMQEDGERKSLLLEAAARADSVVQMCTQINPEQGAFVVNLDVGHQKSLRQIERDAYQLLLKRAEIAPMNRFRDTGARWFGKEVANEN